LLRVGFRTQRSSVANLIRRWGYDDVGSVDIAQVFLSLGLAQTDGEAVWSPPEGFQS
jgi:hypothetical protein